MGISSSSCHRAIVVIGNADRQLVIACLAIACVAPRFLLGNPIWPMHSVGNQLIVDCIQASGRPAASLHTDTKRVDVKRARHCAKEWMRLTCSGSEKARLPGQIGLAHACLWLVLFWCSDDHEFPSTFCYFGGELLGRLKLCSCAAHGGCRWYPMPQ